MNNVSTVCFYLLVNILIFFVDVHMQKNINSNQIQYSQLLLYNQELKTKYDLLKEKLDNSERNSVRLIQRWTQQVKFLYSILFSFK